MNVHHPFLRGLFPEEQRLIPPFNSTADAWIFGSEATGNNSYFSTQWIQCSYQISGGYGPTPRYIFYALLLFTIVVRRRSWIAAVALGAAMTYSASAAIHAFVFAIIREQMVPRYMTDNYEVALVQGQSPSGLIDDTHQDTSLWLPVLPMAWDNDIDAILAIVGTAFLVLLPMQIWSQTLRDAKEVVILVIWGFILFVGIICALVAQAYTVLWAFPQLRFCPTEHHDPLPFINDGSQTVGGTWDRQDWYHWNSTIRDYFIREDATNTMSNLCIYPCFDSSWPLRDSTEIYVVHSEYGAAFETETSYWLLVVIYILVGSSGLSSLTLTILKMDFWQARKRLGVQPQLVPSGTVQTRANFFIRLRDDIRAHFQEIRTAWRMKGWARVKHLPLRFYFLVLYIYAMLLSPLALLFFIGYLESFMWVADPGGESFNHVGQWGTLATAVLVFIAATISHFLY